MLPITAKAKSGWIVSPVFYWPSAFHFAISPSEIDLPSQAFRHDRKKHYCSNLQLARWERLAGLVEFEGRALQVHSQLRGPCCCRVGSRPLSIISQQEAPPTPPSPPSENTAFPQKSPNPNHCNTKH